MVGAAACAGPTNTRSSTSPTLTQVSAKQLRVRLGNARPKPTFVSFWATWCAPCRAEFPLLRRAASSIDDVEFVLVNLDLPSQPSNRIAAILAEEDLGGLTHLRLDDRDPIMTLSTVVADAPVSLPFSVLLDADGREIQRVHGGLTSLEAIAWP